MYADRCLLAAGALRENSELQIRRWKTSMPMPLTVTEAISSSRAMPNAPGELY